MTIRSMTGFAREAGSTGPTQWAWELKTVNGRGVDVRIRTPPGFDAVGEEARRAVTQALARGQCQLNLTISRAPGAPRVRINRPMLEGLLDDLQGLARPDGIGPATLDGLLAVRGVVEVDEDADAGTEELTPHLLAALPILVASLLAARAREGGALAGIIAGQLDAMAGLVNAADSAPGRRPAAVRARLSAQVAALLGASPALDPDRLHQEAVLAAARADIREELDRLRAHVDASRSLLAQQEGAVGRRLDFLAQEFGREANTLCSKANDIELSRIGLDLKAVVEQFREQVQNVE